MQRQRCARSALLLFWRDDDYLAHLAQSPGRRPEARGPNTVIVGQENFQ